MYNFGIDFGTTNSATVGLLRGQSPIPFTDGSDRPFPSLVAINRKTGEVSCGRAAREQRKQLEEECLVIPSVKSYLGQDKRWDIAGRIWTPEMIAGEIFRGLREQVRQKLGEDCLASATVSIPVGFDGTRRRALRQAALMAGVRIESFISEPAAAVYSAFESVRQYQTILVVDWGGGTLDVTVVHNNGGELKELASSGEALGGDDIDRKLAEHIHERLARTHRKKCAFQEMAPKFRDRMIAKCETAKRELSYQDDTAINLNMYGEFGPVEEVVDVDYFRLLITPETERALNLINRTIGQAGISKEEVGAVLLAGGSTNLVPFQEAMEQEWGEKIVFPDKPAWEVAEGAARISHTGGRYITAGNVGIRMSDGTVFPIIRAGNLVGKAGGQYEFGLVEDSKVASFIFVNQWDEEIGYLSVPTFGFELEPINLEVEVDRDLVVKVRAYSGNRPDDVRILEITNFPLIYGLPISEVQSYDILQKV